MIFVGQPRELLAIDGRPPEWMLWHLSIRILEVDAIAIERRTDGATRVTGCWRHEQPLEPGLRENPCVGDAVEGHATAETEVRQPRLAMQCASDVHQRFFEHFLH